MMDKLFEYRKQVILGAFGVGVAYIAGFLPETITYLNDFTNIFYMALLVLGGFCFWNFYCKGNIPLSKPKYQRTAPVRNMSNPTHSARIYGQEKGYGGHTPQPRPQPTAQPPQKTVFDKFKDN